MRAPGEVEVDGRPRPDPLGTGAARASFLAAGFAVVLLAALVAVHRPTTALAAAPTEPAAQRRAATDQAFRPGPTGSTGSLLRPASRWRSFTDLRYSDAGRHGSTSLDLHVPDNGASQVPLIVWIHGGGWASGSKDRGCVPRDKRLMSRGFAVACLNYRLTPEAVWPAQIVDVKAAIRALRADARRYRLYADRIGLWGASAGGHLAAMAGAAARVPEWEVGSNLDFSSTVQAVVDDFGPANLLSGVRDPCCTAFHVVQRAVVDSLLGGRGAGPAAAASASPVNWVDGDEPPFQLWHGDRDRTVPPSQSRELRDRLLAVGVPVELVVQPGMGHGDARQYGPDRIRATVEFFDTWLRPGP